MMAMESAFMTPILSRSDPSLRFSRALPVAAPRESPAENLTSNKFRPANRERTSRSETTPSPVS